ncbi:hypothetical protein MMC34_004004 [Xylographa carneopallida]|nr:hypothetical protein [Xylographa carneopallida]
MRGSNLVDLTGEEHDYPYLRTGPLGSPLSRSQQKVYQAPILVDAESDRGFRQSNATADVSNEAPVYQNVSQMNDMLMGLNGRSLAQMSVSRSPIPDETQENLQILAQPAINVNPLNPPPNDAPSVNEKSLAIHTSNGTLITATAEQIFNPQLRKNSHVPFPAATGHAVSDAGRQSTEIEEAKDLPFTLEAFQEVLQDCLRELRGDHQYYIKSRLAHARQRHTTSSTGGKNLNTVIPTATTGESSLSTLNEINDFLQQISPFTNLVAVRPDKDGTHPSPRWTGRLCQLGAKATKQGPEIITVHCIAYSAGNVTIPPYTNYISTTRNVLVGDDKNRTFLPYYGDDIPVDRDSADLESRITQNRSHYHHTNSIAEKAKLYGPIVELFLTKLGCDIPMILYYLLNESSPAAPEGLSPNLAKMWLNREAHINEGYYDDSEESESSTARRRQHARRPQKQWQTVFNGLAAPSTSREAAAAGIACTAFANVLDFSLWQVVRRHHLVLDIVTRKYRTNDDHDRVSDVMNGLRSHSLSPTQNNDSLATYADLGCLVCYAHECPGHGEFEDEDDKKNVRVRINVKPLTLKSFKANIRLHLKKEGNTNGFSSSLEAAVGTNEDNSITGKPWALFKNEESGFKDDEMCSDECFWRKGNRSASSSSWDDDDLKLFNTLLPAHQDNRRGSCLLAFSMSKPCNEFFALQKSIHLWYRKDMVVLFLKTVDPQLGNTLITG